MTGTVHVDAIAPGDHVVHLFSDPAELARGASAFLSSGLALGGPALVVATPERIASLEDGMRLAGIDIAHARCSGRYLALDAHDVLARFMTDTGPEPAAFDSSVGAVVRSLAGGGVPLRVYGEMVALLWQAGAVPAAAALEDLWNRLGERVGFTLYCAYPASGMDALPHGRALVCERHTHVVQAPDPLVVRDGEVRRHLEATSYAVPVARRMLHEALRRWELMEVLDDAQLVLAELVGNAVKHVGRRFEVVATRTLDGVRVEVLDSDPRRPQVRPADELAIGGRGVLLVSRLSRAWDTEPIPGGGKRIWAEIVPSRPSRSSC